MPTVFCLMGPTAIGKSDLAIRLAQLLPIEIISVDSALVYQGMNIGTAKPDAQQLAQVPHHLINVLRPDQAYSAGAFCRDALSLIEAIQARQKIPLLVGGTMLYFKSLQQGIAALPEVPMVTRHALLEELQDRGLAALYQELQGCDPELAQQLHPHDQQRITRGLEVYRTTGQMLSSFQKNLKKQSVKHFVNCVIWPQQRLQLQQRINQRFAAMLQHGLIEEVRTLRQNYALDIQMNAMRAVGYRQVWQYLEGELNHAELLEQGAAATRQLAKRQLTWLRSWPEAIGFSDADPLLLVKLQATLLHYLGPNND